METIHYLPHFFARNSARGKQINRRLRMKGDILGWGVWRNE